MIGGLSSYMSIYADWIQLYLICDAVLCTGVGSGWRVGNVAAALDGCVVIDR